MKLFIPANILVFVITNLHTLGTNLEFYSLKLEQMHKSSFSNHN